MITGILAGCENAQNFESAEGFALKKDFYKIDAIGFSSDSGEVVFYIKSKSREVAVKADLNGDSVTSLLEVSFLLDKKEYKQDGYSANIINEEEWRALLTFKMKIPTNSTLPEYITLTYLDDSKEHVDISLDGVSVLKKTTTETRAE